MIVARLYSFCPVTPDRVRRNRIKAIQDLPYNHDKFLERLFVEMAQHLRLHQLKGPEGVIVIMARSIQGEDIVVYCNTLLQRQFRHEQEKEHFPNYEDLSRDLKS